ncbi:hypothetical protein EES37_30925 [Streptomyces sp. ADI91-18]|nr:hypothetical protein EES37_30925 [Streptomyces sp. ADI91-18]
MTPNSSVHDGVPGPGAVRQLWQLLEPVHAVVYFAPSPTRRPPPSGTR